MTSETEEAGTESKESSRLDARRLQQERKGIDWDTNELLARVEGDRSLMLELLGMFHEESRGTMEKARTALSKGDLNEVSRMAHGMKGMMKNLSMGAGAEIAAVLEKAATNESRNDSAVQLAKLEQALTLLLREVSVQMTELRP